MTAKLVKEAEELIAAADAAGGMTAYVATGRPKAAIEEAAAAKQAKVDRGETVIVGVNKYRLAKEDHLDILDVDNVRVREAQVARLARIRETRDAAACADALAALEEAAGSGRNLLAAAFEALGGDEAARTLVATAPRAVLEGAPLPSLPAARKNPWWKRPGRR